jgi:hypothetical protein
MDGGCNSCYPLPLMRDLPPDAHERDLESSYWEVKETLSVAGSP